MVSLISTDKTEELHTHSYSGKTTHAKKKRRRAQKREKDNKYD